MLNSRTRAIVAVAAVVLAMSACSAAPKNVSTTDQKEGPTSAPISSATTGQEPASRPSASLGGGTREAWGDVVLGEFRGDTAAGPHMAEVTITNHSSEVSNYIVDVNLMSVDGKTRLDAAMVSTESLAPGQTIKLTARFMATQKLPPGAKPAIAGIARIVA